MVNPKVGSIVSVGCPHRVLTIVVLPALSKPRIKIRISRSCSLTYNKCPMFFFFLGGTRSYGTKNEPKQKPKQKNDRLGWYKNLPNEEEIFRTKYTMLFTFLRMVRSPMTFSERVVQIVFVGINIRNSKSHNHTHTHSAGSRQCDQVVKGNNGLTVT